MAPSKHLKMRTDDDDEDDDEQTLTITQKPATKTTASSISKETIQSSSTDETNISSTLSISVSTTSTNPTSTSTDIVASITATGTPIPSNGITYHAAALTGIIVFAVLALVLLSCLAGLCIRKRHEKKKLPPHLAKRPSYNPFRSSSYSSAHVPLVSDTSHSGSPGTETPGDEKASMFSRERSHSNVSVYTIVPDHEAADDNRRQPEYIPYRPHRLSSSTLVPVIITDADGTPVSDRGRRRSALGPEDGAVSPAISVSRPSEEDAQMRPRASSYSSISRESTTTVSVSPVEAAMTRERSRSSVSLSRFYDPSIIARAL